MSKEKIKVIIPKGATTNIELGLVTLTEYLVKNKNIEASHGLLGGEYGYGCEYENDTFMMHPFCWCEKDDCLWCTYEEETDDMVEPQSLQPNFLYKPTDTKIWWYKYIGRSQEQRGKLPKDWLKKCIDSITKDK